MTVKDELENGSSVFDEVPLSQAEVDSISRSLDEIKAGSTVSFEQATAGSGWHAPSNSS
jgi:hypothetical protein